MISSNPKITVFTPTYNRAYIIKNLFNSLENQTFRDFEWIVIDDGSTDNTELLFDSFAKEATFPLRYIKTENGGKHRAINKGVTLAKGELFFIVDSDDNLPNDALQIISDEWNNITPNRRSQLSGLCGERYIYSKKDTHFPFETLECSATELTYGYNVNFDKAEIFRTEIIRNFPFPQFFKEKFVPEAYIWNRITAQYPMHYFHKVIYNADYIEDGYTKNFKKNLKRNPKGFGLFYRSILTDSSVPFVPRLKTVLRLLQCLAYSKSISYLTR